MSASEAQALRGELANRTRAYTVVALYNVLGISANLAIILAFASSAGGAAKLAMVVSVIAVAVVSSLPAKSIFEDVMALRADYARIADDAFAKAQARKPIGLFINLTVLFNVLIAMVQIWAIYS